MYRYLPSADEAVGKELVKCEPGSPVSRNELSVFHVAAGVRD